MKKLILFLCLTLSVRASADPHLGAAVHFENQVGNPNYNQDLLIPTLPNVPISMIRDGDAPNWRKYELTQGVYTLDMTEQAWIDKMSAAGYPIVFCSGFDPQHDYTPLFYNLSPFPIAQYTAFIKWFVQTEIARGIHIAAIEVIN